MGGKEWTAQEAPVLTNDVPPQRLYSTPAPLKVHFFALFGGMTQRSLHITEWIAKSWKRFSLVCDVDNCSMRSLGHIGNSMQVNLWYSLCWKWTKLIQFTQSLTSQCQNQRKRIKCTFSVTDSKLSSKKCDFFFSLSGYFYGQSLLLS